MEEEEATEREAHPTKEEVIEAEEMTADLEISRKEDASNVEREATWREIVLNSEEEDQDQGQDPEVATTTTTDSETRKEMEEADITAEVLHLLDLEMPEITEELVAESQVAEAVQEDLWAEEREASVATMNNLLIKEASKMGMMPQCMDPINSATDR